MQRINDDSYTHRYYFSARLQRKMKLLASSKAAVIEAPSGYGKTTVMRDYIKSRVTNNEAVYWFSAVDEELPAVLYRRLCREIGKIDGRAGDRLLEIDFPNAFTIGEVCDALRVIRCSRKTWLVIDDFQYLFSILPSAFTSALLDSGSEELCVVLISQMLDQDFHKSVIRLGVQHITASDLKWNAEDIRGYFRSASADISAAEASSVEKLTDGWIIAVHLQLCSYREIGSFSDDAIIQLIENLIWDKMTPQQQDFFMRASPFETASVDRLCSIIDSDTLPDYLTACLSIPFLRYMPEQMSCVPHTLFREMVCSKRSQHGEEFENECLLKAGDVCRDDGELVEAVYFYAQIKNYERILSLDLSHLICAEIGERTFNEIALEIAQNTSPEIKNKYLHSMLCVAWAVRFLEDKEAFSDIMDQLSSYLSENGPLTAEWKLLSIYMYYPDLEKMLPVVQEADDLFNGACSNVILPDAPWAFYEYLQLSTFHIKTGQADKEAALLEEFISIYSRLTSGHGAGADALYRAELAYFRCETSQAEILAHKALYLSESKQQKIIQIGAVRLLAAISLLKSDLAGWQEVVNDIEHAALGSVQNTSMYRTMLDVIYSSLMAQLREYDSISGWLKTTGFMSDKLPAAIQTKAIETHGYYLMGKGEYAQLVGFLQSVPQENYTPYPEHFHHFTTAVGYSSLGDKAQAVKCIEQAAKIALPDDMLHCFVGFSRLLDGLSDEIIEVSYPGLKPRFVEYRERYFTGWFALYNAIAENELPGALTEREREIAELAADGLRNIEIANKLFLSEHTVRAHLRSIYQKLDIDRRAKLAKMLK